MTKKLDQIAKRDSAWLPKARAGKAQTPCTLAMGDRRYLLKLLQKGESEQVRQLKEELRVAHAVCQTQANERDEYERRRLAQETDLLRLSERCSVLRAQNDTQSEIIARLLVAGGELVESNLKADELLAELSAKAVRDEPRTPFNLDAFTPYDCPPSLGSFLVYADQGAAMELTALLQELEARRERARLEGSALVARKDVP